MVVTLPWAGGDVIPPEYTCEGADRSPAVNWSDLPEGTAEVALVVTDLTAGEYVHWIAFGLDPAAGGVAEGAAASLPSQAVNGFGNATYGGPCPPSGTHTYRFTVYALGQQLEIPSGGPADEALAAIGAATLDSTSSTGTFTAT
jgi:Raf kinase inhibitor-like YbhB/YbcL family protein